MYFGLIMEDSLAILLWNSELSHIPSWWSVTDSTKISPSAVWRRGPKSFLKCVTRTVISGGRLLIGIREWVRKSLRGDLWSVPFPAPITYLFSCRKIKFWNHVLCTGRTKSFAWENQIGGTLITESERKTDRNRKLEKQTLLGSAFLFLGSVPVITYLLARTLGGPSKWIVACT